MSLNRFRESKSAEIKRLRQLASEGNLPVPLPDGSRPSFSQALVNSPSLAIIAEFKQASPSRGPIAIGMLPEDVAQQYAQAGANAISVLTEEKYFMGKLDFIRRMAPAGLPMLRKEFIFDALQVIATAATPASALLLIVRLTPDPGHLRELRELAECYGIEAVVEVFDEHDLSIARESGARLIQVNARDLKTLVTDRRSCLALASLKHDDEVWIAASGMESAEHLQEAAKAGFQAALIGTSLMLGGHPGTTLTNLLCNFHSL